MTAARVVVAHPGVQYAPQLAAELARRDMLLRYWTTIGFAEGSSTARWARRLPGSLSRAVVTRSLRGVANPQLRTCPTAEIAAAMRMRLGGAAEESLHRRNAAFQRLVGERDLAAATAVIGFDTSSWLLAERTQCLGKPFVLDQSIGHPAAKEQTYAQLRNRFPQWRDDFVRKPPPRIALEVREHALATRIVAPSRFVVQTLVDAGVDAAKIRINPFGTDVDEFRPADRPPPLEPLVVLFAGALTARKGLPTLLEAWRGAELRQAELRIAGPGSLPPAVRLPPGVKLLGKLSRPQLAEQMRQAQLFALPSHFEGLAQVQIEALASGLPVLGTEESGAGDLVVDGVNGRILPSGNVDAWTVALRELAAKPEQVLAMRAAAIANRDRLSWRAYGDRWVAILAELG